MKITQIVVGALSTNCYIITTDKGNAIVLDPGGCYDRIVSNLGDTPVIAILLTHGHFDHIDAADALKKATGAPLYVHEADNEMIISADKCLHYQLCDDHDFVPLKADHLLKDGDTVSFDDVTLTVMHTPGHTKGSCIYYGVESGVMFTGDTLFAGTLGRTDHYGGDHKVECESLKRIAGIAGDFKILPGHGEHTTLEQERRSNPYMGTNYDDIF